MQRPTSFMSSDLFADIFDDFNKTSTKEKTECILPECLNKCHQKYCSEKHYKEHQKRLKKENDRDQSRRVPRGYRVLLKDDVIVQEGDIFYKPEIQEWVSNVNLLRYAQQDQNDLMIARKVGGE